MILFNFKSNDFIEKIIVIQSLSLSSITTAVRKKEITWSNKTNLPDLNFIRSSDLFSVIRRKRTCSIVLPGFSSSRA